MQVIHEANNNIAKLWGEGKIKPDIYRLFTYLLTLDVDDGTLVHNVVTGELILLKKNEMQKLSTLPCSYDSWMDELIKKHFIVRADFNDKNTVDTLRKAWKLADNPKEIVGYTILPTTNCNARCFYCYEAGCKHDNMTDETADKLANFIETCCGGKPVSISWFGGEPLVGIHQIDRICKSLKEKKIEFSSSMISNGYLFDEKIVKRAKEDWNLKKIQITLDGTEKVYNETKAYVSPCESPFKKVLDNIDLLIKKEISVDIRLNLGLHNAEDLNNLADQLATRFDEKKYLSVYSYILFEDCGFKTTHFSEKELDLLNEKRQALTKKLQALSLLSAKEWLPHLKKNFCMADNPNSLIVVPTGMLGKCEHYVDKNFVGNLNTGITDKEELKLYGEYNLFSDCQSCKMYPSCIMLKRCVEGGKCLKYDIKTKIDGALFSMKGNYEEYLRENKKLKKEIQNEKI